MDSALASWLAVEDSSDDISVIVASICLDTPKLNMKLVKSPAIDERHAVPNLILSELRNPSTVREVCMRIALILGGSLKHEWVVCCRKGALVSDIPGCWCSTSDPTNIIKYTNNKYSSIQYTGSHLEQGPAHVSGLDVRYIELRLAARLIY